MAADMGPDERPIKLSIPQPITPDMAVLNNVKTWKFKPDEFDCPVCGHNLFAVYMDQSVWGTTPDYRVYIRNVQENTIDYPTTHIWIAVITCPVCTGTLVIHDSD